MGLLVADLNAADLDLEADALAADDLLEDLAEPCLCEHTAGDHTPEGCRACLCPAIWDGLGAEDLEDVELEVDAARVTAVLFAARTRRRKFEEDRADAAAKDPARLPRSNRPRMMKAKPKAPHAATTKPTTPHNKAIPRVAAPSPQPPAVAPFGYEGDGRLHGLLSLEEEALAAVGAL